MQYSRKAVPTLYNGIQFRSKLEAQWAAMFDRLYWNYTYEPYEINGRVPDFIIYGESKVMYGSTEIIVEVKPKIFCTDEWLSQIGLDYKNHPAHILILTERPFYDYCGKCAIGKGAAYHKEWVSFDKEPHPATHDELHELVMKCYNDFSSYDMIWDGMVFDKVERKYFLDNDENVADNLRAMFKMVANDLQFDTY